MIATSAGTSGDCPATGISIPPIVRVLGATGSELLLPTESTKMPLAVETKPGRLLSSYWTSSMPEQLNGHPVEGFPKKRHPICLFRCFLPLAIPTKRITAIEICLNLPFENVTLAVQSCVAIQNSWQFGFGSIATVAAEWPFFESSDLESILLRQQRLPQKVPPQIH